MYFPDKPKEFVPGPKSKNCPVRPGYAQYVRLVRVSSLVCKYFYYEYAVKSNELDVFYYIFYIIYLSPRTDGDFNYII